MYTIKQNNYIPIHYITYNITDLLILGNIVFLKLSLNIEWNII